MLLAISFCFFWLSRTPPLAGSDCTYQDWAKASSSCSRAAMSFQESETFFVCHSTVAMIAEWYTCCYFHLLNREQLPQSCMALQVL
jgi:hypothetical protein